MPSSAKWCVEYHHAVQNANGDRRLAAIAAYANLLSHCHGAQGQPATPATQPEIASLIAALGLTEDQNDALVASMAADFQNSGLF